MGLTFITPPVLNGQNSGTTALLIISPTQVSMAHASIGPTFQSLPPEIRNEVYGHLFGNQDRIELIHKFPPPHVTDQADESNGYEFTSTPKPLSGFLVGLRRHSAILRTCRQIYQEAVPILYGSTVFSFPNSKFAAWIEPSDEPHSFPAQSLQHIQKLEITVDHDEPVTSSRTAERTASLIEEAVALRQLDLSFSIWHFWVTDKWMNIWAQDIVYNSRILEVIKASRSLRKVRIELSEDRNLDEPRYFAPFVHAITTMKDWSCEHDHGPLVKAEEGVDDDGNIWKQRQYGHKWTWSFQLVPSEAIK